MQNVVLKVDGTSKSVSSIFVNNTYNLFDT